MKDLKSVQILFCLFFVFFGFGSAGAGLSFEKRLWKETPDSVVEGVAFSFPFVNEGEATVTITEVKSSCGCTTAELEKKVYEPGEKGEITGVFRIGARQGLQRKTVRVTTDDVAQPEILLTIEVDIPKLVSIEPGMVLWKKGAEPDLKSVKIVPNQDLGVEVTEVTLNSDDFVLEWMPSENVEDGSSTTVIVSATDTSHSSRGLIRIKALLPDGSEKQFFAHALVR